MLTCWVYGAGLCDPRWALSSLQVGFFQKSPESPVHSRSQAHGLPSLEEQAGHSGGEGTGQDSLKPGGEPGLL